MSRIGKKPVAVPDGVKVEIDGKVVKVSSSSSTLTLTTNDAVEVAYDAKVREVTVSRVDDSRFSRAMHGTTRAHIANMVEGVGKGFEKRLRIYGTGYGVKVEGTQLLVSVGFAKPAGIAIPGGVDVEIHAPNSRGNEVPAEFAVRGADKCIVGQFAAEIRKIRPPEPYRGKGIRYADEVVKRKVGKAFASSGA